MPKKAAKSTGKRRELRGKLESFNISPRGTVEGAIFRGVEGAFQINLPKDAAAKPARWKVGSVVVAVGERKPDHDHGAHPVYELAVYQLPEEAQLEGRVVRLNYARHGEVNGAHLDNGTFLHLKPDGARKHELEPGDSVQARGRKKSGADADVIEPDELRVTAHRATESPKRRTSSKR